MTRGQVAALAAILLLSAAVRFYALGREPLWIDEQGQYEIARKESFAEFWDATRLGGPIGRLSYVDSWLALKIGGHTRTAFRAPSVLWGIAAIAMIFVLARRWFSTQTALFAAALLSVHALHVQYSREARGYALLVFVTLLFAWLLDRVLKKMTALNAALLILFAALCTQIHPVFLAPLAALSAMALLCIWFMRPPNSRAMACVIVAACCLSALLFKLVPSEVALIIFNAPEQKHTLFWHFADIHKALLGGYWGVMSYVVVLLAAVGLVVGSRSPATHRAMAMTLAVALAASAPIVFNFFTNNWVVSRYSIFALPFFMLMAAAGFAWAIEKLSKNSLFANFAAVVLPLLLLGGMALQGRSLYELERDKIRQIDAKKPSLPE